MQRLSCNAHAWSGLPHLESCTACYLSAWLKPAEQLHRSAAARMFCVRGGTYSIAMPIANCRLAGRMHLCWAVCSSLALPVALLTPCLTCPMLHSWGSYSAATTVAMAQAAGQLAAQGRALQACTACWPHVHLCNHWRSDARDATQNTRFMQSTRLECMQNTGNRRQLRTLLASMCNGSSDRAHSCCRGLAIDVPLLIVYSTWHHCACWQHVVQLKLQCPIPCPRRSHAHCTRCISS